MYKFIKVNHVVCTNLKDALYYVKYNTSWINIITMLIYISKILINILIKKIL
jgi:hypothetical protein